MNNYIPLNKAVNPVCIYEGNEPLINKKIGVDSMTFNFDGTMCEHASCPGAPEMFIKVEKDGLHYFGVEADDKGSITIADEKLCEKTGERPHGKLELKTGSRYLKAGYYKIALSYGNNAYDPVSNNAIAFNITIDTKPIQEGKYTEESTMKRTFSTSSKINLWTIEKESNITCEPSKEIELEFEKLEPIYLAEIGDCETQGIEPKICVTVCKDEVANVWKCRVASASAGAQITIREDRFLNPYITPPLDEQEATEAVNSMNGYQARGRVGNWHTPEASLAHENHHCRQFEDACKFYWKHLNIQEDLEQRSISCNTLKDMDEAIAYMNAFAKASAVKLSYEAAQYIKKLPDGANDRPYCAGQEVLNEATGKVIQLAKLNEWTKVPDKVTPPGTIEPPCFQPPINGNKNRSKAIMTKQEYLKLFIMDTSQLMKGNITVCFRNEGSHAVRIPDEINDKTANYFFITILRSEQKDLLILNSKIGKMTFQRHLKYLQLAPGEEYRITIPVCLNEVDQEKWKQCSCELETTYYNQQGKCCFLGALRATSKIKL